MTQTQWTINAAEVAKALEQNPELMRVLYYLSKLSEEEVQAIAVGIDGVHKGTHEVDNNNGYIVQRVRRVPRQPQPQREVQQPEVSEAPANDDTVVLPAAQEVSDNEPPKKKGFLETVFGRDDDELIRS